MAAKDIWVFVENGGSGLELLAPARELAAPLGGTACALTPDGAQAEECAACGAGRVLILDGAENAPARALAPSLADIIGERSPAAVLFASTDMGRELAVRIARRLGSGFVADAEGFEADGSGGIVWSKS
ncbi:MAG TPA: electron transfer flavoprotein subunit alpha/FixB family protein, partial [Candidatus Scatomorpha stercoravium]|nr:electron transfer flavoprotein subunit alpha/FixB family protein [Candidatus Scatomorpha stercoravium]